MIKEYCNHLTELGYAETTVKMTAYNLTRYHSYIRNNFHKRLTRVSWHEIESYCRYLKERLNPRSLITVINHIKGFYKHLVKEGYILIDPTEFLETIKASRNPKHVPDEEAVKILLNQPSNYTFGGIRDRAMLELMYSTGIRRREMVTLLITDIDLKKGLLKVRQGKGGCERIVPVGKSACLAIERYLTVSRPKYVKQAEQEHLFITDRGKQLKYQTVNEIFRKYKKNSKLIEKISPHSLRHACALHMLRGGAPIIMVQKMLGHKRISSTQIYTRLYPKDLKAMHAKHHPRERELRKQHAKQALEAIGI